MSRTITVNIFEDDKDFALLLEKFVQSFGYAARVFPGPDHCPAYQTPTCTCPSLAPCADIMITDFRLASMNAAEFFERQSRHGCKIPLENKAIMSAVVTPEQKETIEALGCHFLSKPFRRTDIKSWLDGCAERLRSNLSTSR